jgi:outer membrane protein assembly factor BamB
MMAPLRLSLLALVIAAGLACAAEAQDWTRFRGPNGSGVSEATTIPTQWTEADFNWRVALPAIGHSQPVFWGEKIFVASAEPESGLRHVTCLSTKTGETLWDRTYPLEKHGKHALNSFASGSPTVDADRVYALLSDTKSTLLVALDHDGKEAWKVELGPFSEDHGHGTSPIVFGEFVLVGHENEGPSYLAAYNRNTGEQVWKTARSSGRTSFSTPMIFTPPQGTPQVIFNSNEHGIAAVDLATGEPVWQALVFDKRTVSSPVEAGGNILGTSGSGGGGNILAAVNPGGRGDVTRSHLTYRIDRSSDVPYVPTPVAKDELLFLWTEKGVVLCCDAKSGEVVWKERVRGTCWASPIIIGDRLFNITTDGEVIVLSATNTFAELARNPVLEGSHTTLAVHDGVLYARTFGHLVSVGGK